MPDLPHAKLPFCRACAMGKQCRGTYPENTSKATRVLDRIHSDILGPVVIDDDDDDDKIPRYVVTFLDEATHYLVVEVMHSKWEMLEKFQKYVAWVKAQTGGKCIKTLRCDNGGELPPEPSRSCVPVRASVWSILSLIRHSPMGWPKGSIGPWRSECDACVSKVDCQNGCGLSC